MGTITVRPDSRGRIALRSLVDLDCTYSAQLAEDGTITLAPIAHVMTEEQYRDLQADPAGYAELLARARAVHAGDRSGIPAAALFDET